MPFLKRFAEWYLGIPPAAPGQGTDWSLHAQRPWPAALPPWAVLLIAIALIAFVVWVYRRDAKAATLRVRLLLTGLRVMLVVVLLAFLCRATLSVARVGLPVVVVLIDDSASMSLEDQYPDKDIDRAVRDLLSSQVERTASRINLAKALLSGEDAWFLKDVASRHKLRVYRFSDTAVPLGRGEYLTASDVEDLIPLIDGLKAEGDRTRPGPSVRKVLNELRGTPPSAVVIITDGISSTGDEDKLSTVAELAASAYVPIYAVGIGSADPARDVQLYDALVEDVAFVDDVLPFSAKMKTYGFRGQDMVVSLRADNAETVLASKSVRAEEDGKPVSIELPYTPTAEGEFDYTLEIVPLAGEVNLDNNSATRHVSVRGEKMRVLLVDSEPRYEFRALKEMLQREKTIDVDVVLQDADIEFASEDKSVLNHFPLKRDELFDYDVVIFGDVNLARLGSGAVENLRDFVLDAGGGLIMVAGRSHNPLGYAGTPLEVMVPIELSGSKAPPADQPIVESFHPLLTIDGRKGTSLFRFAENDSGIDAIWDDLPEFYWLFAAPKLKKGARVFVEHSATATSSERLPVISMQHYGAGKVLFHATDELWRWRYLVGDLYYGKYRIHAIRFLSRSKLLGRDRSAELSVDRPTYERGETVRIRARFLDGRLVPAERDRVTVMLERRGDAQRKVELTRVPQAPQVFEGIASAAAEGTYHAWVANPSFKEKPPSVDFRVEAPHRELQSRSLDVVDLRRTAELTRGRYFSLADAAELPESLPGGDAIPLEAREPIPLWNRPELLLLFASLLAAEWLLRKRLRLI